MEYEMGFEVYTYEQNGELKTLLAPSDEEPTDYIAGPFTHLKHHGAVTLTGKAVHIVPDFLNG